MPRGPTGAFPLAVQLTGTPLTFHQDRPPARLQAGQLGPVFLLVDGYLAHRPGGHHTEFVACAEGRLKLFLLPGFRSSWTDARPESAG
jgi:hypothetical protein